ncbi:stage III sporulation protein AD [Anaerotignum faecicola]|nr:stage III sporulation protein AD [Anaerotignum faecicola]
MEILQIVILGIVATLLSVSLKNSSPNFSLLIGLVTGILIFLFMAEYLKKVLDILINLTQSAGVNGAYIEVVLKIMGIAYISRFGAELCKDAGESAVAAKIDLAGKVLIAVVSSPVILALMEMVQNFI